MDKEKLINSFFEDTLDAEEHQTFAQLLETDKTFADQVKFEQQTKAAITLNARESLKAKLQDFEKEYTKKPAQPNRWWFVAAGIAALIGILFFFQQPDQLSDSELYSQYFTPYPNTVAPIVRSRENITPQGEAFQAYESGNYVTAAYLFRQVYEDNQQEYAQFYAAISLMGMKEFEKSKDILASTTWSSAFFEKAQWYLALNYLAINQTKNSQVILQNIVSNKSYNFKKAAALLKKFENSDSSN